MTFHRDRLQDPLSFFESQGLVPTGSGKWRSAGCPSCGGTSRFRFNTETGAHKCMALCGLSGGDIVSFEMAMRGVEFIDAAKALGCWTDDPRDPKLPAPTRLAFRPRDALEVLRGEAILTAVAAGNIAHGVVLTDDDRQRVLKAAHRIIALVEAINA